MITNLLEALMIFCFGISWPISIVKSYKSRTAKGKSLFFVLFVSIGYIFGIVRKIILFINGGPDTSDWLFYLGWAFYVLNFIEIMIDIALYYRNVKLDELRKPA